MLLGPVGDKFGARRTFGICLVLSGLSMVSHLTFFFGFMNCDPKIVLRFVRIFFSNFGLLNILLVAMDLVVCCGNPLELQLGDSNVPASYYLMAN